MNKTPIFTTDIGGKGIFTCSDASVASGDAGDANEISMESPISVASVCKKYNLKKAIVVDSRPDSIISLFDSLSKIGTDLLFGYKITVCHDCAQKDEPSRKTESKVIVFLDNENAWVNFCKIWTYAEKNGFYYIPRTDWKALKDLWCDGLSLGIPFYDSFLYNNLFTYDASCVPDLSFLKQNNQTPTLFLEDHKLPVDKVLREKVQDYAENNKFPVDQTHTCYYYDSCLIDAYGTFRCIKNKTTMEKPNLDGFCSDAFAATDVLN